MYNSQIALMLSGRQRDEIDKHFDDVFAFMDRPKTCINRAQRQRPRPLRGKGMYPSPVGVAEFVGGEKIRMSFWQPIGKPWRFDDVRDWLCKIIGNERGRAAKSHQQARDNLRRRLDSVRALNARPGSAGEGDAASRALARLTKPEKILAEKASMAEVFSAMSVWSRVYPPATDIISFHIEHDGKQIDATVAAEKPRRPARLPAHGTAKPTPFPTTDDLMREMERRIGEAFLDTKAWRRVRARVAALSRAA